MSRYSGQAGFSLVELLLSTVLAVLLLSGMQELLSTGMQTKATLGAQVELNREARFAMRRLVQAVRQSDRLLLPSPNNPATDWDEHIRVQTIPASAPQGSSTLATAVLGLSLGRQQDLDFNGIPDADNDADGRLDEDPGGDLNYDLAPGLFGIDDDGDGSVDEQHTSGPGPLNEDDDEDDYANENGWSGLDEDGDGKLDEDPKKDMNGDGLPGIGGVDDDLDGLIDEGDKNDDDEDGLVNEDWVDSLVFYLSGAKLMERRPVPWDANVDLVIDGSDTIEFIIADNVSLLRFERLVINAVEIVDITLTLTAATQTGESVTLNTRVRLGSNQ